jgi:anti-anti-sigma regulatory factor
MAGAGGIQVSASTLPPELEEAAILFANAQPQAAVATLKAALRAGMLAERTRQGWLMLLDVLQSVGERAEFESVAIEFAARFEQSPPAWQDSAVEPAAPRQVTAPATVRFGARLDGACARHVEQARRAGANGKTVTIDLTPVAEFDQDGATMVCELLDGFAAQGRELVVLGAPRLYEVARAAIEPGRRDEVDGGWKLALAALRLLGEKQAFDDLSIDYCVTYEVSPPSWEPMPANVRIAGTGNGSGRAAPVDAAAAGAKPARSGQTGESGAFALRGEIAGRMLEELAALRAFAKGRGDLVIDCRALRRLDFVAAGELLNEVVGLVGQGHTVLFAEPSAIVEALLVVMGIHEAAEIRRRRA